VTTQLAGNVELTRRKPVDTAEAVSMTVFEFKRLAGSVVYGLKEIVTNFASTAEQVSGPIAIISVGAELARNDLANLFQFAAIVNINLAVVNTLPLPALDGGYLALLIVEAARGKKLPQEVEQAVMSSGFLLLLTLGVGLIIRDTINLF
jgi:RIP metalloprotease RseP